MPFLIVFQTICTMVILREVWSCNARQKLMLQAVFSNVWDDLTKGCKTHTVYVQKYSIKTTRLAQESRPTCTSKTQLDIQHKPKQEVAPKSRYLGIGPCCTQWIHIGVLANLYKSITSYNPKKVLFGKQAMAEVETWRPGEVDVAGEELAGARLPSAKLDEAACPCTSRRQLLPAFSEGGMARTHSHFATTFSFCLSFTKSFP